MAKKYVEKKKLAWPVYHTSQDRAHYDDFAPTKSLSYASKYLIRKGEGRQTCSKDGPGVPTNSHAQPPGSYHYIYGSTCNSLTLACGTNTIPPGHGSALSGAHWHTCEEAFYVVKGKGWFEIEGERFDIQAGDWVFVPARAIHSHMNTGDEPMEVVFAKGIRLRGYDGPTEGPLDYREFDVVETPER